MADRLEHLDQLKVEIMRPIVSLLLITSIVALTGCDSGDSLAAETAGPQGSPTSNRTPEPSTSQSVGPVLAYKPTNEKVLGSLDEQEGVNLVGPLTTDAPAIAVYLTCVGSGEIALQIPEVGDFPLVCDTDQSAGTIKNVFDIRYVKDDLSVNVKGLTGQRWAVSVAETEQPERG